MALAVAVPAPAAVLWGIYAAPQSSRGLDPWGRLAFELAVFAAAALALVIAGAFLLAAIFAGVVILNASFLYRHN